MKRIKQYQPLLLALQTADPDTRVGILRSAPEEFIKTLLEIMLNFLHGNIPHNATTRQKLKRHRLQLHKLSRKRSMKIARRELVKQKGGFLPLLIAPLLALTAPAIARKVSSAATDAALDRVVKRVLG